MKKYTVEFPGTDYPSIQLEEGARLPDYLTPENSPVIFGCRNGICATCLIEIENQDGDLSPAGEEELDTLENYAAENPKARLACQLRLTADIKIKKIDPI